MSVRCPLHRTARGGLRAVPVELRHQVQPRQICTLWPSTRPSQLRDHPITFMAQIVSETRFAAILGFLSGKTVRILIDSANHCDVVDVVVGTSALHPGRVEVPVRRLFSIC